MTTGISHMTREALEAGLEEIGQSPADGGILRLIVRRPAIDGREVLQTSNDEQTSP